MAAGANGSATVSRTYTAAVGEGSDIINVRVIDAVGAEASAIVPLVIRPAEVLSLTAFASDTTLDPGGMTEITASATGGVPPYLYEVTKQDSLGTPANDPNLSQFTSPSTGTAVFAAAIPGRCAAPPAPATMASRPRSSAAPA